MIIIIIINGLSLINVWIANHLGKNPIKGGNPPNLNRVVE